MALTVQLIKRSGGNSARGYKITEVYGVRDDATSECNLGPIDVMALSDIPKFGERYAPTGGCDTGHAGVLVESVDVSEPYSDGQYCSCTVTVVYGQPDEQLPQGYKPHPQHNTSDDPIDWKPELEIRKSPRTVERGQLTFLGASLVTVSEHGFQSNGPLENVFNDAVTMVIDLKSRVCSTAGEMFNPPYTEEVTDTVITIGLYLDKWTDRPFDGYVNKSPVRIKIDEWNYDETFPTHTIKMGPVTGRPGYRKWKDDTGAPHERTYWLVQYELIYRPENWWVRYNNVGTQRIYRDINQPIPDGRGGTLVPADFPAGAKRVGPVVDVNGMATGEPVALGKDGQPITDKDTWLNLIFLDARGEIELEESMPELPTAEVP